MKKAVLILLLVLGCGHSAVLAQELLINGSFEGTPRPWKLLKEKGFPATMRLDSENQAVVVDVEQPGVEPWHVQLLQDGLPLEKGRVYRLRFRAKADPGGSVDVKLGLGEEPYSTFWSTTVDLTPEWQDFDLEAIPSKSTNIGRFAFNRLAGQAGVYEFGDVSLVLKDE